MFVSAIKLSSGRPSVEPTAICNYATFLFRQRRDAELARRMFLLGLTRFPKHAGLRKNYKQMLRSLPPPRKGSNQRLEAKSS